MNTQERLSSQEQVAEGDMVREEMHTRMVDSWLSAPLLRPSSSRMTIFQRCHVLRRLGWRAKFGGQIARSLNRVQRGVLCKVHPTPSGYPSHILT